MTIPNCSSASPLGGASSTSGSKVSRSLKIALLLDFSEVDTRDVRGIRQRYPLFILLRVDRGACRWTRGNQKLRDYLSAPSPVDIGGCNPLSSIKRITKGT